ncbi:hypothetical protein [Pseudomonas baetica]|uniref:hypothetical protein n=1 Tax=Pseudomonas baetica TaxID=674054 RepID=UPI002404EC3A|nr:hypothetical protein [Pseudomonas baetica]MDF9779076.1 hypothetical protein [Pseudomonas baetica]
MTRVRFLTVNAAQDLNLPSLFFPLASTDGAEFQVEAQPYPAFNDLHDMLIAEDDEFLLVEYDTETGRGFLRVIDWTAPEPGTVLDLVPVLKAA